MGHIFGTDGVRGIANIAPMTVENVLRIGRATAYVCKRHGTEGIRQKIVIGKDTRVSGYMLENALTAGICSMGVDVLLLGPLPTPGIAFITQSMRADAGIVLSASHNPYMDNGIKIFSRTGNKLPDAEEAEIEELINSGRIRDIRPTADEVGRAKRIDDAIGRYIVFCKSSFPDDLTLDGLRIVVDCSNGATYKVAPVIFYELGAEVFAIHNKPDGININANCGSQHTEDLRAKVLETQADLGLAFDGDGDRLIAVDETGQELSGDHIIAITAAFMKRSGTLAGNRVVTTVMSNFGLHQFLKKEGIQHVESAVGDRHVLEKMKETDAILGGEASGHIIHLDHHTTGDGIIAALQLLVTRVRTAKRLSVLASGMTLTPQTIINVNVTDKPPLEGLEDLQQAMQKADEELGGEGRQLVRYSGTQSMCRIMVEGPTEEMTNRLANELADIIKRCIG
jgi:phosphoglucosamine mutase